MIRSRYRWVIMLRLAAYWVAWPSAACSFAPGLSAPDREAKSGLVHYRHIERHDFWHFSPWPLAASLGEIWSDRFGPRLGRGLIGSTLLAAGVALASRAATSLIEFQLIFGVVVGGAYSGHLRRP